MNETKDRAGLEFTGRLAVSAIFTAATARALLAYAAARGAEKMALFAARSVKNVRRYR